MAGVTVNIYPGASNTGLTHTTLSPAVYNALSGTELNIIRMLGGHRYPFLPTDLGGTAKWGLDKPVWWQIDSSGGSDTVIIDCASRFAPDSTAGEWDPACGMWYIDVYTGGTPSPARVLYVGAEAGETLSSMQWGSGYRPARFDSGGGETIEHAKARCGSGGMTAAGILNGESIWCSAVVGSSCRVWIWTPFGQAVKPAVYWGGLVIEAPQTSGQNAGATPRYSPFVVGVNSGSGANNPGGTLVEAGFVSCYPLTNHAGHHRHNEGWGAVTDVRYKSLRCFGGAGALFVGHDGSKSSARLTAFRAEDGLYHDDLNDPDLNPMSGFPVLTDTATGASSQGEAVAITAFADNCYVNGLDAVAGTTHGFVNIGLDTATLGQRAVAPYIINVRGRVRRGSAGGYSRDARALSVNQCTDAELYNFDIVGTNTRSHVCGERTRLSNISLTGDTEAANDTDTGKGAMDIRSDLDVGPMSVTLRRIYIDRRSSLASKPWSCIEIRGSAAIAANAIKIFDSVLQPKAGYAAIWMWDTTGTNVNRDQKIINVWTSGTIDTKESDSQNSQGTTKSFAAMFNGAGAEVRGNNSNVAGDILARPDSPMKRVGSIALSGA